MKYIVKLLALAAGIISASQINAQTYYNPNRPKITSTGVVNGNNIETMLIPRGKTTHIYSPDPILYVDIASNNVEGDIQEEHPNILRIRPDADSFYINEHFLVTVVTKNYITTLKLVLTDEHSYEGQLSHIITIDPNKGLVFGDDEDLHPNEFKRLATLALTKKRTINNIATNKYAMELFVNNLYTIGDYVIVDMSIKNNSNIQYDINEIRFRLEDLKVFKATVSQELEMKPVFTLYQDAGNIIKRKKSYRNIYIFKKFTYPTQKKFVIELTEKEISGRKLQTSINYNQLLKADYFL